MQELAQGQGVWSCSCPAGPLLEYNPDKVKQPPTTAQELLAWCKANPNRFIYARPANSGPGRTFMMGLPYILGDKDPKDPDQRLGQDLGLPEGPQVHRVLPDRHRRDHEGARRRLARHDRDDDRLGHQPARARHRAQGSKVTPFKGMTWVNDAHYMVHSEGRAPEKLAVLLDLMKFMLTSRSSRPITYDKGYFYPGPAVKNVPLSMAPKEPGRAEGIRASGIRRSGWPSSRTPLPLDQAGRGVRALGSSRSVQKKK
jgi:putative spermidine/putrescine transport system substrate-binding protein